MWALRSAGESSTRKNMILGLLALALSAELLASLAVWHGTPTDWPGEGLRLWRYEALRLGYWSLCCVVVATGLAIWNQVGGWGFSNGRTLALGFTVALGVEALTSILFWGSLTVSQVGYLGWPDLQYYIIDHLICWATSVAGLGLVAWVLLRRSQSQNGQ